MIIKSLVAGSLLTLIGSSLVILLQSYVGRKNERGRILLEIKLETYAEFYSGIQSQKIYPGYGNQESMSDEQRNKYNDDLKEWNEKKKRFRGLITVALFLTKSMELQKILKELISNSESNIDLEKIMDLMRKEISNI